jgi:hypothetical protein
LPRLRLIPLLLTLLGFALVPLSCGNSRVPSPFGPGAGGAAGEGGGQGDGGIDLGVDAGDDNDPTLGGPCQDDGQCDDAVECTVDACDQMLGRCRFSPDGARCDDGVYCNGVERCDVREGCEFGEPVACTDNTTCTIDVCVEATQSCRHDPRDADGDGDPTRNCDGGDCDDAEPLVSSLASEVCGNQRDDNCDGQTDEQDCSAPEYDSCETALVVTEPGFYDLDLTATALDYPSSCAREMDGFRDAVLDLIVPEGGPFDVDVTAKLDQGKLALGTASSCGDLESASCEASSSSPLGASVARLIFREATPGSYPLYVATDVEATVQLQVQLRPAQPKLGELCEDAVALVAGAPPLLWRLPGYAADFESACAPGSGDGFARFTLDEASDVTIIAESQSDLGLPVVALLDGACQAELTCRRSQPGRLFERNLPPGQYGVLVAATGPDDVSVRLETGPVTEAPPGEGCDDAQPLTAGVEQIVDLSIHEDAVHPMCLVGAPDASFGFELEGERDVALIGRFADGDEGAVSLATAGCTDNYSCQSGVGTQRAVSYGLAAGSYRALIESARGNPVGLSWFERPAVAGVHVPFADDCESLVTIPETGGRFSGNTSNAFPDFSGGCDVGGQAEAGAPDQVLKLSLSVPRRVVFDMQGSAYETMLSVRSGKFCPGVELPLACAPGYRAGRSYLDLDLQPGDYFIQIDGYDGDAGAWKLDIFTARL